MTTTGRNEPCPCGSGKKYKKCCYQKDSLKNAALNGEPTEPQFRFEPGSYGDSGVYMPSIACMKLMQDGGWEQYFVLVNPELIKPKDEEAVSQAEDDLSIAFMLKDKGGSDDDLAMNLKDKGYISVNDFNIVAEGGLES